MRYVSCVKQYVSSHDIDQVTSVAVYDLMMKLALLVFFGACFLVCLLLVEKFSFFGDCHDCFQLCH